MQQAFAKFILTKVMGWTLVGEPKPDDKLIYVCAPHTSVWDFLIGYLYYRAMGGHLRVMIKKEAFFPPLSWILRAMGGFPIDRSHPQKLLMGIVHEMESLKEGEKFHLVICPEGTRKAVKHWKTGYHTIAVNAGIPVYLTFFDFKRKRVGISDFKLELTDNARADTDRMQEMYESLDLTGLHPEDYVTH